MIICQGRPVTLQRLRDVYQGVSELHALDYRSHTRRVKFPGICRHAQRLGVSRIHLYYVLTGVRRSPRIEQYLSKEQVRRVS